jgi:ribosomal protein S21
MGVRKKGKEPFEVLLRRFNREIQTSSILTDVKKRRYNFKDVSRQLKRVSAQRKAERKLVKRGY